MLVSQQAREGPEYWESCSNYVELQVMERGRRAAHPQYSAAHQNSSPRSSSCTPAPARGPAGGDQASAAADACDGTQGQPVNFHKR
jgi:hypothetical protein